jgi:MFS transporter, DHA1 family, solute carrier family 18 (vesicular amine transporter), member 1/2
VPRRRLILAVAVGAVAMDTALLGLIAPLLPDIERRTGASEGALGVALAADAVPIVLFSLPLGRAADAFGRRAMLIAGVLLIAGGSVLIAVTESLGVLIAGRAVQGLGSAASWIAALTLVSDLAPPGKRGESIGIALAATGAGSIGGPALGGVTADLLSYAAPFLIVCGLSLALAVAATFVLPRESRRPTQPTSTWRTIARSAGSGIGAIATGISLGGACALGVVELVAPLDLDARLGLSSSAIGLLFAGSIAVDAALAPLGGRWGDRRGRWGPAVLGLVTVALSIALLALLGGTLGAAVALGAFGAGYSLAFAAAVPWLDETFGEVQRGLGYGLLNVLYAAGYAIGPVVGGALLELGSADLAYWVTAVAFAAGAVVLARASTMTAPSS